MTVAHGRGVARVTSQPLARGITMAGRTAPVPTQVEERLVEVIEHPFGCARVVPGGIGLPLTGRVLE